MSNDDRVIAARETFEAFLDQVHALHDGIIREAVFIARGYVDDAWQNVGG